MDTRSIHCPSCNKRLFDVSRLTGRIETVCPRCKHKVIIETQARKTWKIQEPNVDLRDFIEQKSKGGEGDAKPT